MSKVFVDYSLKSKEGVFSFSGKGIKSGNRISFNDNGVMTVITLGESVILERKKDYFIKLGFCTYNSVECTYIIPEGSLEACCETKELICEDNYLKVIYSLTLNNVFIDEFELNFNYSIDSD